MRAWWKIVPFLIVIRPIHQNWDISWKKGSNCLLFKSEVTACWLCTAVWEFRWLIIDFDPSPLLINTGRRADNKPTLGQHLLFHCLVLAICWRPYINLSWRLHQSRWWISATNSGLKSNRAEPSIRLKLILISSTRRRNVSRGLSIFICIYFVYIHIDICRHKNLPQFYLSFPFYIYIDIGRHEKLPGFTVLFSIADISSYLMFTYIALFTTTLI